MKPFEARVIELLEQLVASILAMRAVDVDGNSLKPSAVRMRRLRQRRLPSQVTHSHSGKHRHSDGGRPLVVRSLTAENEEKKKIYAPGARIPSVVFRKLHCHFGAAFTKATGKPWHTAGSIPPVEKKYALELLRTAGSLDEALRIVDRFARLWRENDWTRHQLGFDYRIVVWSKDKIRERKHRLHLVSSTSSPAAKPPRPRAVPPPAPAPVVPIKRVMPDGPANVRNILEQLKKRGVSPVG